MSSSGYVIQVIISTGTLKFCTQVIISKLTQVDNSYLYFVKKEDQYFKKIDKFKKTKTK